ncbi:MAG: mechanosensitive ion channel, partial [Bacteroidales bacterium]
MKSLSEALQRITGLQLQVLDKIIASLIIFIIFWIVRFIIIKILWRKSDNVRTRYHWRRNTTYTLVFIMIFVLGFVWIERFQRIGTFLGLLSAGIAIALKDLLANLAGWIFILVRKPFKIGDRIEIENYAGDVIDIHVFRFTLLEMGNWVDADQTTGRVVHIPNGKIFISALANYHAGFNYIWNEIPVRITFESNWQKAKEILTNIINTQAEKLSETMEKEIKEASKKFMIHYKYL